MKKIAITTSSFGDYDKTVLGPLIEKGYEILLNPHGRKLKKEEIPGLCRDAIGIIAGTEILDGQVMADLPHLRVISRCGTGMDNVDQEAAKQQGIKVFNTPDAPTVAVAELTVGLIFDMLRRISRTDREIRAGEWNKHMGNLLNGKSIGIVGFGRIGRKVAELLLPFGVSIGFYDIIPTLGKSIAIQGKNIEKMTLQDLLKTSDIISLHVASKATLFGKDELAWMKKGAWLVNVSRGGIVNEEALYESLKNNHLAGAALDVFMEEPYKGPLRELNNVILTAHIGSYGKESRIEMEHQSVMNLLKGLE